MPSQAASLEGTVVDPSGKPVQGAVVVARSQRHQERPPLSAKTDAAGRFVVASAVAPPYDIAVDVSGFGLSFTKGVSPGTRVRVRLSAGATIEGSVRDGGTGSPAVGARVEARVLNRLAMPDWEHPDFGIRRTTADGEGRYKLTGLLSGVHEVSVWLRGTGRGTKGGVRAGERADIVLLHSATILGIVLGEDDRPLEGASVTATSDRVWRSGLQAAASRSDGAFELGGLGPGEHSLLVRHSTHAPTVETVTVPENGEASIEVRLRRGVIVTGRLVDPKDRPLSGGVSLLEIEGTKLLKYTSLLATDVTAGADGVFRLANVPAGSSVIEVRAAGFATQRVDVSASPRERQVDVGDIRLDPGLAIGGRVRTVKQVVAEARVSGFRRGGSNPSLAETFSEPDGSFTLGGLEAGSYMVWVQVEGFAPATKDVEAGAENVDIVVEPGGTITGVVVDANGAPVSFYRASAQAPALEDERGPRFAQEEIFDADGRFTLKGLDAATYVVTVEASDRARKIIPKVNVSRGAAVDIGRIKLAAGARVSGIVVDGQGNAVAGARIAAKDAGGGLPTLSAGTSSDLSGVFELKGLEPGPITLRGEHPNFAAGRTTVEISLERPITDARLVLQAGGRVSGTVTRRGGTSPADLSVTVTPSDLTSWVDPPLEAVVGADGTYAVEHVSPGHVSVALVSRARRVRTAGPSKNIEVRDGETSMVDFSIRDILISGQVTRGGAPVAGCHLQFVPSRGGTLGFGVGDHGTPAGPQRYMATTGEDGTYQALLDEPGTTSLNVRGPDGRFHPGRQVEVPDADAFTFDVTLGASRLVGIVVDRDSGEPVAAADVWAMQTSSDASQRSFGGSSQQTSADGRFELELDPGEYEISAKTAHHEEDKVTATVTEGGGPDVRIALSRGMSIAGKIVRSGGHGFLGTHVFAAGSDGSAGHGFALPDGSFRIGGLKPGPYNLTVHAMNTLVGLKARVEAGAENVVIEAVRLGKVVVRVLTADGAPVSDAWVQWTRWNGESFGLAQPSVETSATGSAEITAPAGAVEITGSGETGHATVLVDVPPDGVATVEMRLQAHATSIRRPN